MAAPLIYTKIRGIFLLDNFVSVYEGVRKMCVREYRHSENVLKRTVSNPYVRTAMVDNNIFTVSGLCRRMGYSSPAFVSSIINNKLPNRRKNGDWRKIVLTMSHALKCLPEELFPSEESTTHEPINISFEDVNGLLTVLDPEPSPETLVIGQELRAAVGDILRSLTPREERVLRLRFGFNGLEEQTLEEVAQQMCVTRERIRQIEMKAIRKIRCSHRTFKLRRFSHVRRNGEQTGDSSDKDPVWTFDREVLGGLG
ncbi:sigma-70 family RNA polymerase sigma factor [candidate division KSB1 bacterium]